MRPSTVRSLGKKCIILILVIFAFWLLIRPEANTQRIHSVTIKNRASRDVWDYVADINHLKITNPYLRDFHIIADGGVYPEWHYIAILKEDNPVLGSVESQAEYIVKPSGNDYVVIAVYNQCKFLLCVYVNSTLTFISESPGEKTNTVIREELKLWIPNIMLWFWDAEYVASSHLLRIESIKRYLDKIIS